MLVFKNSDVTNGIACLGPILQTVHLSKIADNLLLLLYLLSVTCGRKYFASFPSRGNKTWSGLA